MKVFEVFNLSSHFENFTNSIFDVTGVLYFLSVIAICIFLTMQTILKRRCLNYRGGKNVF